MQYVRACLLSLVIVVCASPSLFGHVAFSLAIDEQGNIYFLDVFKRTVMKVTAEGKVSILIDFRGKELKRQLHSLALSETADLYIAGYFENKIWKFSREGELLPFSPSKEASLHDVLHVGFDASGALIVLDWHFAAAREAQHFRLLRFHDPEKPPSRLLMIDGSEESFLDFHVGSMLVVPDASVYFSNADRIWRLGSDRRLELVAGGADRGYVDDVGGAARFNLPWGMCRDRDGAILVAERSGRIRRVDPERRVSTLAGAPTRGYKDGALTEAQFSQAFGVGVGPKGRVFVAEYEDKREYRIRVISGGRVSTLARIPSDGVFER